MRLQDRLDALRREAGASSQARAATTGSGAADLRRRLERLGTRPLTGRSGTRWPVPDTAKTAASLAHRLGGEVTAPGVIVIERRFPGAALHGRWPLSLTGMVPAVLESAAAENAPVVYLDTETTGLSGGAGTLAFNVGLAVRRDNDVLLRQWLLTGFTGESTMLADVATWLRGAHMIVTYNGACFDLPLLRSRARLTRSGPWPEPLHLDLLPVVRRLYRGIWPRCRLADVEQRLLGLHRHGDMPGAAVPAAWRGWLSGRPDHGLDRVISHNAMDVLSLGVLPGVLERVLESPMRFHARPRAAAGMWRQAGRFQQCHRILGQISSQQWLDFPDPIA